MSEKIDIDDLVIDFGQFDQTDWQEIEQLALQFQESGFFNMVAWKNFVAAGIVYLYLKEARLKELNENVDKSNVH